MRLIPALGLCGLFLVAACATDRAEQTVQPGHRPALASTEAGLWMRMDKAEKKFAVSDLVVKDAELQQYLEDLLCELAADHCADIRIYVVDIPFFNATMAPNGAMNIWTGLLLRAENEAQLAAVLGHELAHYLNRHQLKQWNSAKLTTDVLAFFTIATGGIGYGAVGLVATLGAMGHISAYSRELETEADQVGQEMIHQAGYPADAASELWQRVDEEQKAMEAKTPDIFLMTHPAPPKRAENLKEWGAELTAVQTSSPPFRQDRLMEIVAPRWQDWLQRVIQARAFKSALYVIDRLEKREFGQGLIEFYRGEVHRRRAEEGDFDKAREYYLKAASHPSAPPALYKQIGLIDKRSGMNSDAARNFEAYLRKLPNAADKALILSYIKELRAK